MPVGNRVCFAFSYSYLSVSNGINANSAPPFANTYGCLVKGVDIILVFVRKPPALKITAFIMIFIVLVILATKIVIIVIPCKITDALECENKKKDVDDTHVLR